MFVKFPNLQTLTLRTATVRLWQEVSYSKGINKPFGAIRQPGSNNLTTSRKQVEDDWKTDLEFARSVTRHIIRIKSGKLSKLVVNIESYDERRFWRLRPGDGDHGIRMRLFVSTWNWTESFTRASFQEHRGSEVLNRTTIDC